MSAEDQTPPFSSSDVARMIEHMNDDHADSVLAYAQHFGKRPAATSATLVDVKPTEMQLKINTAVGEEELVIAFDHQLESGHDAHMTMIKMSKAAKKALKDDA
ncbi:MAG: DUF2470 domain-containing protein [Verrucomicrobiota bacterium]